MRKSQNSRNGSGSEARQAEDFLANSQPANIPSPARPVAPDFSKNQEAAVPAESLDQNFEETSASYEEFTWVDVGLCLIGALLFSLACTLVIQEDKGHVWAVTGDIVRNLSGIIVVVGAWIAWETNKSRSNEAEKSDFRDRMRWAVENSDHENQLISEYAAAVIRSFNGKTNVVWMSYEDKLFVQKALEQTDSINVTREEREKILQFHIEEVDAELQSIIETSHRPLSPQSGRKLREAEVKRAAHEFEHPYSAIEKYVEDVHAVIDAHLSEEQPAHSPRRIIFSCRHKLSALMTSKSE